ncbi:uncharacterized protein LOC126560062 [Anopheles maculipalpis]|uniref:uncharacterized protein LOC126560062 n=1 Tax=Anopheles maculipalpis TaxID=1496333 RepID=UPI002159788F|nr:uncharacterized protein LOC126560062 [Anopheles maculipalpis]
MLFRFLLLLTFLNVSCGQNEYPNYPEDEPPKNYPEAYPIPNYDTNPAPNPEQPAVQPHYPDYSYVETVETTTIPTTTTTTRRIARSRRPQVFPPTPTARQTRPNQANRVVRYYFLDDQGYVVRSAVRRRYRTGSLQMNGLPPYYRNILSGARSIRANGGGGQTRPQRVDYWWNWWN